MKKPFALLIGVIGTLISVLALPTLANTTPSWLVGEIDIESQSDDDSPLARAVQLIRSGDLKAAEQAFKELIDATPDAGEPYIGLAEIQLRLGDPSLASAYARQAVGVAPDSAPMWMALGNVLVLNGNTRQARSAYTKSLRLDDQYLPAYMAFGDLLLRSIQDTERAAEMYQQAILIDPERAAAHFGLGSVYATDGNYASAEAAFEKAASLASDDPLAWHTLGRVLAAQEKFDLAVDRLSRALAARPDFQPARLDRADIYAQIGRDDDALKDYRELAALRPDDAQLLMKLALLTQRTGDSKGAMELYQRTLAINPNMALAYNNLAWLQLENSQELDQAYEQATRAIELAPDVPQFQDTLAWISRARGDLPGARQHLERAAELRPPQASVHYHLGIVYQELGMQRDAESAFNTALEIDKAFSDADDAKRRLETLSRD